VAAADEFPRGLWLQSSVNGSGTASVTFPAAPGVAWVLTDIDALTVNGSTVPVAWAIFTNIGPGPGVPEGVVSAAAAVAGQSAPKDEWSWSGQVQQTLGAAVTVNFNAPATASTQQFLNVRAYPI
jgi:hypothetical protein